MKARKIRFITDNDMTYLRFLVSYHFYVHSGQRSREMAEQPSSCPDKPLVCPLQPPCTEYHSIGISYRFHHIHVIPVSHKTRIPESLEKQDIKDVWDLRTIGMRDTFRAPTITDPFVSSLRSQIRYLERQRKVRMSWHHRKHKYDHWLWWFLAPDTS
jgi:hypothetical protein